MLNGHVKKKKVKKKTTRSISEVFLKEPIMEEEWHSWSEIVEIDLRNCFKWISTEDVIGFNIVIDLKQGTVPPNCTLNYALIESIQKSYTN